MKNDHHATVSGLLGRRNLLRHTALAALLAPVVRMRDAEAAPAPRRVVLIYNGNGPYEAAGPASGTSGTSTFTMHDWWNPLDRHRADGIFISHMAATGTGQVPGNAHGLGGAMYSGYGANEYTNRGETIDQVIGKRLEQAGRHGVVRSVVWGLARGAWDAFSAGINKQISPEVNPQNAWRSMFAQFVPPTMGTNAAAVLLARKRSVLDFVHQDCKSFGDALGAEGRRLLEDHCGRVRSMEAALSMQSAPATNSCTKPGDPGTLAWTDPENVDAQMDAFNDLICKTLACELTHVVAFQISGMACRNRIASGYGVPSSDVQSSPDDVGPAHHPWTHNNGTTPERTKALRTFTTFYSSKVALLVDKLKASVDVSGKPLLDSTVVLWLSELGGNPKNLDGHNTGATPAVLFGGGQGTFKVGRYLRGRSAETQYEDHHPDGNNIEPGRDMAKILVSMIHYMGFTDVNTVGESRANGPFMPLYG